MSPESVAVFTMVFTGLIAIATVIYTVATARLLSATKRSVELTREALLLSAMMQEAELAFRENEQHPDGSQRFGAEQSRARSTLREYQGKVIDFRQRIEALGQKP
jgi:hypothetical protein